MLIYTKSGITFYGSVCCSVVGCRFGVAAGPLPRVGEAECWCVGASYLAVKVKP